MPEVQLSAGKKIKRVHVKIPSTRSYGIRFEGMTFELQANQKNDKLLDLTVILENRVRLAYNAIGKSTNVTIPKSLRNAHNQNAMVDPTRPQPVWNQIAHSYENNYNCCV